VIVAHLSDLHLRDTDDAVAFAQQLDRVVERHPDHLIVTGDLLDRWNPDLLHTALDLLAERALLHEDRLTLIHGNHDLASSGGHPRTPSDLRRLLTRFWDPPPVLAARKRAFYRHLHDRAPGVARLPPFAKETRPGLRFAALDTVPAPWRPLGIRWGAVTLRHGEGRIPAAQTEWLWGQGGSQPLVVLVHHYPLPVSPFEFDVRTRLDVREQRWIRGLNRWRVVVPMAIDSDSRNRFWRAVGEAGAALVACGHVHRARLERQERVPVGLNGQSGATWAGRTIAYYRIDRQEVTAEYEETSTLRGGGAHANVQAG
jgi:3',5'-cyclic AMP phosphodiesterase CpdA